MCGTKFFICRLCGNLVGLIDEKGGVLSCCGKDMEALSANTAEASQEKHLPVISAEGDTVRVKVGSAAHPMTAEHYISFVYLQTGRGGQRRCLNADEAPEAVFVVSGDKPVAAFAYCNLHGLWKTEIN